MSSIKRLTDTMGEISAASSLKAQAQDLVQLVAVFKLGDNRDSAHGSRGCPLALA